MFATCRGFHCTTYAVRHSYLPPHIPNCDLPAISQTLYRLMPYHCHTTFVTDALPTVHYTAIITLTVYHLDCSFLFGGCASPTAATHTHAAFATACACDSPFTALLRTFSGNRSRCSARRTVPHSHVWDTTCHPLFYPLLRHCLEGTHPPPRLRATNSDCYRCDYLVRITATSALHLRTGIRTTVLFSTVPMLHLDAAFRYLTDRCRLILRLLGFYTRGLLPSWAVIRICLHVHFIVPGEFCYRA